MGSVKRDGKKLTIVLEIEKILMSPTVSYVGSQPVEGPTFKALTGNLALMLANKSMPSLGNKIDYASATIDLSEDKRSVVVVFE